MTILLVMSVILNLINLFIFVFLVAFIVRFRQTVHKMFGDLVNLLNDLFETIPVSIDEPKENRSKTWDEKYEEDLEASYRRKRENSGLQDLKPASVSWGAPPAINPQNLNGLTIRDNLQ